MNLLLPFVLSAALSSPVRPAAVAPDSGSVAFTTATVWLRTSSAFSSTTKRVALLPRGAQVRVIRCQELTCNVEFRRLQGHVLRELLRATPATNPVENSDLSLEDNLALLMSEHRLSLRITPFV